MNQKVNSTIELPQAEVPSLVQNGHALVTLVRIHLDRDKDDDPSIAFEVSLPLSAEHSAWMPPRVLDCWGALQEYGMKKAVIPDTLICNCILALVPVGDDRSLILKGAAIENIALQTVKITGEGKAEDVTRLQLRIRTAITDDSWRFARAHFGHAVWFSWELSQGKLFGK